MQKNCSELLHFGARKNFIRKLTLKGNHHCGIFTTFNHYCQEVSRCRARGESEYTVARALQNEEIHPRFETQGRGHQKSKTGVSVAPKKILMSSKRIFKKFILVQSTFHFESEQSSEDDGRDEKRGDAAGSDPRPVQQLLSFPFPLRIYNRLWIYNRLLSADTHIR